MDVCQPPLVSFSLNGVRIALKSAQETNLFEEGNLFHFISNDKLFPPLFQWTVIFPYNSLYTQSCRIHHVFWAWELVLYRIQNGGLTTQHGTDKRRESFLIWSIFDRNFIFKWVIVSIFNLILCFFHDSSGSESIRVDPSWSDPDWRSELIRSDFCTCLTKMSDLLRGDSVLLKLFSVLP